MPKQIKCVGCKELQREEVDLKETILVVYGCTVHFPYRNRCAINGLFRPTKAIREAVSDCDFQPGLTCILCSKPGLGGYGHDEIIFMCEKHDNAWFGWLEAHPERRAYIAPRGRAIRANWIEVFREFIEAEREGNDETAAAKPIP